jgi:hypothetical protein
VLVSCGELPTLSLLFDSLLLLLRGCLYVQPDLRKEAGGHNLSGVVLLLFRFSPTRKTTVYMYIYFFPFIFSSTAVVGYVFIQAECEDSVAEAKFVQNEIDAEAKASPNVANILAIVAKADLSQPLDVLKKQFDELLRVPKVRGVRQLLNWDGQRANLRFCDRGDLMTDKQWRQGLGL